MATHIGSDPLTGTLPRMVFMAIHALGKITQFREEGWGTERFRLLQPTLNPKGLKLGFRVKGSLKIYPKP